MLLLWPKVSCQIIDEVESQVRIVTIGEETSWQEKWNVPGTKSDQNSTNRAKVSRSEAFPARIVFSEQHFAEIYRRKFASRNQAPDGHGELPQFSFAFHPLNSQFRLRSIKLKMNLNHFLDVTHNVKQTFWLRRDRNVCLCLFPLHTFPFIWLNFRSFDWSNSWNCQSN